MVQISTYFLLSFLINLIFGENVNKNVSKSADNLSARITNILPLKSGNNDELERILDKIDRFLWKKFKTGNEPFGSDEKRKKLFQSDIFLTLPQAKKIYSDLILGSQSRRTKRKFTSNFLLFWDSSKPIPYKFAGSYSYDEKKMIEQAINMWQASTCLKFVYTLNIGNGNGLIFANYPGCSSNVGKSPASEAQEIFISSDPNYKCMKPGVIAHEIGHALGFFHEISRPDRDKHVEIVLKNARASEYEQFFKERPQDVDYYGVPYDYGSIMQYSGKALSKGQFTILAKKPAYQFTMGQRDKPSFYDIKLMNSVYCANRCTFEIQCRRGGYQNPNVCSKCICPDGFEGDYCQEFKTNSECGENFTFRSSRAIFVQSPSVIDSDSMVKCNYLFRARKNEVVGLRVNLMENVKCDQLKSICIDFLEIRNSTDLANTGMRFCCLHVLKEEIFSESEEMLILARLERQSDAKFMFHVRSVPRHDT